MVNDHKFCKNTIHQMALKMEMPFSEDKQTQRFARNILDIKLEAFARSLKLYYFLRSNNFTKSCN